MLRGRSSSTIWLISIGAVAALLVIGSLTINLILDARDEDQLPADTAEGTVQRYLQAVIDDDYELAYSYVSRSLSDCSLEYFLDSTRFRSGQQFSVRLIRTADISDTKVITVTISESEFDGPFSGYQFNESFTLTMEQSVWRFTEPPWPVSWCPPDRVPAFPAPALAPVQSPVNDGTALFVSNLPADAGRTD